MFDITAGRKLFNFGERLIDVNICNLIYLRRLFHKKNLQLLELQLCTLFHFLVLNSLIQYRQYDQSEKYKYFNVFYFLSTYIYIYLFVNLHYMLLLHDHVLFYIDNRVTLICLAVFEVTSDRLQVRYKDILLCLHCNDNNFILLDNILYSILKI